MSVNAEISREKRPHAGSDKATKGCGCDAAVERLYWMYWMYWSRRLLDWIQSQRLL